jgi:hypothetical protein
MEGFRRHGRGRLHRLTERAADTAAPLVMGIPGIEERHQRPGVNEDHRRCFRAITPLTARFAVDDCATA